MSVSREEWARRWAVSKRSPRTSETYLRGITAWFEFLDLLGVRWDQAEQHDVDAFWHTMADSSPATVAKALATVSSFYRHVLRHGRPSPIDRNPVEWVDRPKVSKQSRRPFLHASEVQAFQQIALTKDPRSAALVYLLLGTALRVSEAVNATVAGLSWNDDGDRTLDVVRKGGASDVVTLEPHDWQVLERYLTTRNEVPDGWLFATTGGRKMSRQTAYRLVREVADEAVRGKKIGPHALRRTFATLALGAGEPIQEVQAALRHASSSTTQIYDGDWQKRGRSASRAVSSVRGLTSAEEST